MKSKYGTYGVLGNHEYYDMVDSSRQYLIDHHCYIMKDEVVTVNNEIVLVGRDDREGGKLGRPERKPIEKLIDNIDNDKAIVIIDH